MASGVSAKEMGMRPSERPTRNTASHSRPLAECRDARVTPSTTGASWVVARRSSSWAKTARVKDSSCSAARPAMLSASATSARRDSHLARVALSARGARSV